MIHALNLSEGGGIFGKASRSDPMKEATVVIGIGGTGVASLKVLKKKIYSQLNPSNPGSPIPEYNMIKLLAIDTDDTDIARNTVSDLDPDTEFASAKVSNLAQLMNENNPNGKPYLRRCRDVNGWMSIDQLQPLAATAGAGGIRQMGRFMLLHNSRSIYNKIMTACRDAVTGAGTGRVNVHILAGLSGGTGSGAFMDVCYLVRQVIRDGGWSDSHIFGYFFLPDVVISKPEVKDDETKCRLNRRNGYAAFIELDYLMKIETTKDYFTIYYPDNVLVPYKVDRPPVDMCHLLSATDSKGVTPANGFNYCINVAADYIMAYLADITLPTGVEQGAGDGGLTMEGHLTNTTTGAALPPRTFGANRCYHVLGASNAEVPITQIATYLAAGLFRKFMTAASNRPDDGAVDNFARQLGLNHLTLVNLVTRGQPAMPELSATTKMIPPATVGNCQRGTNPQGLAQPCLDWEAACRNKFTDNGKGMTAALTSFDQQADAPVGQVISYVCKIHQTLMTLCLDQAGRYGPYYAAELLTRRGRNLISVVDGLIAENGAKLRTEQNQDGLRIDELEAAKTAYAHSIWPNREKKFAEYKARIQNLSDHRAKVAYLTELNSVLQTVKSQLTKLADNFYRPLTNLLNNLNATFAANENYLAGPEARQVNAYTWRVVQLADVQPHLDEVLKAMTAENCSYLLVSWLLKGENIDIWLSADDYRIGSMVNAFMQEAFADEMNRSIEYYIQQQYPNMDTQQIIPLVKSSIIAVADQKAEPMFWCNPGFSLDSSNTYISSSMSVPASSPILCSAADSFQKSSQRNYTIRKTAVADRIFALRFNSGIPLYAYNGVTLLSHDYEAAIGKDEAGLHLFEHNRLLETKDEKTEQDLRDIGRAQWGTYLPSPIPASQDLQGQYVRDKAAKIKLYKDCEAAGIIRASGNSWNLYCSPVTLEEIGRFQAAGSVTQAKLRERQEQLDEIRKKREDIHTSILYPLQNDGGKGFEEETRIDYFIGNPPQMQLAEDELEKYAMIEAELALVRDKLGAVKDTSMQIRSFTEALLLGVLEKKIGRIVYTYEADYENVEERLSSAEPELDNTYLYYKAYKGYCGLSEKLITEIGKKSKARMENLDEDDGQLVNTLFPAMKAFMADISETTAELEPAVAEEIKAFYRVFLDNIRVFKNQF